MSSTPTNVTESQLLERVNDDPSIVNIAQAACQLDTLRAALGRVPLRLACTSSFMFDPIAPSLVLQGLRAGLNMETFVAPYGQHEQMLLDPASPLAAFKPQAVLLAVRLQDVCPAIYERFNTLASGEADRILNDWFARLHAALAAFRRNSDAYLLIQNYDLPPHTAQGIADAAAGVSQLRLIRQANDRLHTLATSFPNVYILDYDALVARHGRLNWADPRTALFARIPVAPRHYWALAGFYVRHLRPLYGLSKKVLVLDADHTLWGGVVGDLGLHGIQLGHDYPGNAFVAFQQRILDLYHRGIVLCIASKNEPGYVDEVLEKHPEMVLRPQHFAAMAVNWDPKPQNLRKLAADLNLGLDSFVFIDDSPVECELMRTVLPEVLTVHLPKEPAAYPGVIESLDCFDQWTISAEDRQRGQMYKAEAGRKALECAAVDMPSFYRQLEMRMTLFVDHLPHLARAAQMTARTNQFNMHTIRCSEDDIRRFMESDDCHVITLDLADRFGENGIVGIAVVRKNGGTDAADATGPSANAGPGRPPATPPAWQLHMLLMSCRILGRTVEHGFIKWIARMARTAGAPRLLSEFVPTGKNKPFSGFYEACGFTQTGKAGDIQIWTLDLATADLEIPDWLTIQDGVR